MTSTNTVINPQLNPRATDICKKFNLSLGPARCYIASHLPWDAPNSHVMLGFTDDFEQAFDVLAKMVPAIPGETFSVQSWS